MQRMGFGAMATGGLLAYIARYKPKLLKYIFPHYFQLSTLLIVLTIWIGGLLPHMAITDEIYAFLFAIIIVNFALNKNNIISLENKVFDFLGKISFGLYVYHIITFSLLGFLCKHTNITLPKHIGFLLGIGMTIVIAALSYQLIEKPFLKLKAKRYSLITSGNDAELV